MVFLFVLGALCLFLVFIAVHEFGHFLAAKLCGIGVVRFAIGMGPVVYKRLFRGTEYSIRALPLGGFVELAGANVRPHEIEPALEEYREKLSPEQHQECCNPKRWWVNAPGGKQVVVLFAGPLANVVLAFLAATTLLACYGEQIASPGTRITSVVSNSPAARVGIQIGDEVQAVNGISVNDWHQIKRSIAKLSYNPLEFTLLRDGQVLTVIAKAEVIPDQGTKPIIGIGGPEVTFTTKEHSLASALENAGPFVWNAAKIQIQGIKALITGRISVRELSGPVGLTKLGSDLMARGLAMTLVFTVVLNVALAIMNLIPLPVLDGGQILFGFYKMAFKREFNFTARTVMAAANWAVLLLVVIAVTVKDVWQIFVP